MGVPVNASLRFSLIPISTHPNDHEFPIFSEWSVVHFLHQSLESKESVSFINNVITDLSVIERTVGAKKTELTNFVKDLVKSIKRALAPTKRPINKAEI